MTDSMFNEDYINLSIAFDSLEEKDVKLRNAIEEFLNVDLYSHHYWDGDSMEHVCNYCHIRIFEGPYSEERKFLGHKPDCIILKLQELIK